MSLNRETAVTYLGHATFLIESPGGRRILLDPFLGDNPSCPAEWKDVSRLGRLDLILLTHMHNDHSMNALECVRANPDAAVVTVIEAGDWLETKGAGNVRSMHKGGAQTIAGVQITMTHADHSSSYQEPDGTTIYMGEPAGYILKMENGFTIYDAGDTALFGDMALLRELYRPSLALLPIGDLYTMGPFTASHAVKLLGVSDVIPMHYGTWPILTGTLDEFRKYAGEIPNVTVHGLVPGQTLR